MANTKKNGAANAARMSAVEYADAIKCAVDELAAVIRRMNARGLTISAAISFGRILNVGIRAAGTPKTGRPPKCPIVNMPDETDGIDIEVS